MLSCNAMAPALSGGHCVTYGNNMSKTDEVELMDRFPGGLEYRARKGANIGP